MKGINAAVAAFSGAQKDGGKVERALFGEKRIWEESEEVEI